MHLYKYGNKKFLFIFLLIAIATSTISGLITVIMGDVLDLATQGNVSAMAQMIPAFSIMIILFVVVKIANSWTEKTYIQKSMELIKSKYMSLFLKKDIISMKKVKDTTYVSHLTNDADRLEKQYFDSILMIGWMVAQIAVTIIILGTVNIFFVPASLLLFGFFAYLSYRSGKGVKDKESNKSDSLNEYTAFVNESMNGFEIVKQHQLERVRHQMMEELSRNVQNDDHSVQVKSTFVDAANNVVQSVMITGLVVFGLVMTVKVGLSFGTLMIVVSLFSNLLWPFQALVPQITQMRGVSVIFEDYEKALKFEVENRPMTVGNFESLTMKSADLGYDHPILNQLDFTIHKGEKILIVGRSGEGKSTLLKTMRQSIKPLIGSVLLNGVDQSAIDYDNYFSHFAVVDQHGYIFNGSVADNVSLMQKKGQVEPLLIQVKLDALEPSDLLLNDGSNISGGQRARLLLARALYFQTDVVICDEIFASLDAHVGEDIERDVLSIDQTVINVSHIVFAKNLDMYDRFFIVGQGVVEITQDKSLVLARMIENEA